MTKCEFCGGNVKIISGGKGIGSTYYEPDKKPVKHVQNHGKRARMDSECTFPGCELSSTCGLCGGLDMRIGENEI